MENLRKLMETMEMNGKPKKLMETMDGKSKKTSAKKRKILVEMTKKFL